MRVILYARVSSEEQVEGYSLEAQRRLMRQEAARRGFTVVTELADEGKSAKHDTLERRPAFRTAVEMVKAGQADAIMVHKPDRAARNLRVLLQVLHELGGGIVAVEGDFDYTTPEGKLRAHIMGSVAQWYSDNLSREVKKGKDYRRAAGLWNGRLPFGLRKQPDDEHGRMAPVPDDAPILCTVADRRTWSRHDALLLIFERCAAGHSLPTIVAELHGVGFPLGLGSVWDILNNRFYLGEIPVITRRPHRQFSWLPGAHPAFIERRLFERAAASRERNKCGAGSIRRQARVYPLTGLCRCGRCGDAMHCRTDDHGRARLFCHTRHKTHTCDLPSSRAEVIEEACAAFLQRYSPPEQWREWLVAQLQSETRDTRRERAAIETRLRRLRDLYQWGDITADEYTARRRALEQERAALPDQTPGSRTIAWLLRYLRDFAAGYADATWEERNALLREVFEVVELEEREIKRVRLRPAFDAVMGAYVAEAFGSLGRSRRRR